MNVNPQGSAGSQPRVDQGRKCRPEVKRCRSINSGSRNGEANHVEISPEPGKRDGLMTALDGIGHTLPFLLSDFRVAMTAAVLVVVIELGIVSWVPHRYMETPAFSAALQVGLGGILVFATGVLIGSA